MDIEKFLSNGDLTPAVSSVGVEVVSLGDGGRAEEVRRPELLSYGLGSE